MNSVSAAGGLSTALNSVTQNKQAGPPDHAKAWGWRAKQAASAEETQAATTTETTVPAETTDAVEAVGQVDQTSPDAAATLPPPSEADMKSVILGVAAGSAGQTTTPEYDVTDLFT